MAKMEKIRKMQIADNKENKFFCFSYDFYALYRVWVRKERLSNELSIT